MFEVSFCGARSWCTLEEAEWEGERLFLFCIPRPWDRRGEATDSGEGAIGIMILRKSLSLCEIQ